MATTAGRLWRTLSAFNSSTRRWAPVPFRNAQNQPTKTLSVDTSGTQSLSLVSWNIDGFSSRPVSRANLILKSILEGPNSPDILFLQEVTSEVRSSLLRDARVRTAFLTTDAEDQTSFEDVPFATMTLLSRARFASDLDFQNEKDVVDGDADGKFTLGRASRISLPSKYRRDALYVDITPPSAPGTVFRFINVHLDSLWDTLHYRAQQMEILANALREPGCSGGIIAGDFNAIRPEDGELVDKNALVDAWIALHDKADGASWGVGVERRDGLGPGRLDKVAMLGLKATEMEILRPGFIEVPKPGEKSVEIPWSDHCGLRCNFTI